LRVIHKKYRDIQRRRPAAVCARCGGEVYPGESVWRLGGRTLCPDCAGPWLLEELSARRIRLGEARL